ncbi:carboxymuconolactone decarboxylase family protein [Spongiimicrobium salis]|uniref:carboxymuconolactone decarboxylase family protein n=1 Tax=Spongiimicrobium salis TaxID=1667022 RepID=UPI00374D156F
MKKFHVPTKNEVNSDNQIIFDHYEKNIGFMPNSLAIYAHSENALKNYLNFNNAKTSLNDQEKEAVNLVVSQVNHSHHCVSVHTFVGRLIGFTDAQMLELRKGKASFDPKIDALVKLAKDITAHRGNSRPEILENFFKAGWTKENLIDAISLVGDKTIANYMNSTIPSEIDFPVAPRLEEDNL